MYYFCTYFDKNYLPRGLALYYSLRQHCHEFSLWILCMDQASFSVLTKLALPSVNLLSLAKFEQKDELLVNAKRNRSKIEYYFTCTPSLPLYILNNWPEVDLITYIDADLFFFASPTPLFDELETKSIAIIGHRYPPHLIELERFGIYNVGWLSFRRDENALDCLNWWRKQCLEWCYDREEDGRFADQKYLDDWPDRFKNVVVLEHKGANLAPWNLGNYQLHSRDRKTVMADEQPLLFFHFHGLKKIFQYLYDPGWIEYGIKPSKVIRQQIYKPYLRLLLDSSDPICGYSRGGMIQKGTSISEIQRVVSRIRKTFLFANYLFNRKFIFVISRYIF